MTLIEHAKSELQRAGLDGPDDPYDGMLGHAVFELIEVFSKQGHSGFSATLTCAIFKDLAEYKALTPITSDPSEWQLVSGPSTQFPDSKPQWQSTRQPNLFSHDGGETWYSVDDPRWNQTIRGWNFRRKTRKGM